VLREGNKTILIPEQLRRPLKDVKVMLLCDVVKILESLVNCGTFIGGGPRSDLGIRALFESSKRRIASKCLRNMW
jgi:hypothetical protein